MTSLQWIALIEKSLIFAVGLGFGWMGYRLLRAGLYEHAEGVKNSSADGDLLWKQVLPGLTFTLFAGVVVVGGLYQPSVTTIAAPTPSRPPVGATEGEATPAEGEDPALELDLDLETPPLRPFESPGLVPEAGSLLPFDAPEGSLPPFEAGSGLGIPESGSFLVE